MARLTILNPKPARPKLDPVPLAQQIPWEAMDVSAGEALLGLEQSVAQLHGVHPEQLTDDAARIAFWTSLYNAPILHCLRRRPLEGSLLRHMQMFDRIAYVVGGCDYSLNLIEHGILRANRRLPFSLRCPLRSADERLTACHLTRRPAHPLRPQLPGRPPERRGARPASLAHAGRALLIEASEASRSSAVSATR